jgi:AraC family transcriptional regulator, regulatory protein of adaptative response / DNA-3-methyladenine glycosylase II
MSESGQTPPARRASCGVVSLEPDACYRALVARDPRFDGAFFVGVKTTGIYCRPVCRARTPGRDRCVFYPLAAEAERDGFRACFRCRPELAPAADRASVPTLVRAAAARIGEGALDDAPLAALAADLGVTARHLGRAMTGSLGVSPGQLAQSRRMALAKQLLHDSSLSMADVAFSSGFSSVRRFNAAFLARFGCAPSALRRGSTPGDPRGAVTLRLDHRPPLAWGALLDFLAARAVPGVESVSGGAYRRTARMGERRGWVSVRREPGEAASLRVELSLSLAPAISALVARLRRLLDLDAHPLEIDACLGRDALLAPLVGARPGLRVPGAFDGFETAVRAVLGQQVSVGAATTLAGRLAASLGEPIDTPHAGLTRLSAAPAALVSAGEQGLRSIGLPRARASALASLAAAAERGQVPLEPGCAVDDALGALQSLPGFGPWTAHYVAMRALGWPDAFPASDLGIRVALGGLGPREATARAEAWRPWRSYAVMHLWGAPRPSEKKR